jgi:hypothetical protein
MPRGSRPFHGGRGSVDYDDAEYFAGDPRIAPGLPRPIGWRVRAGDGSAAYDKYGPLDTNWVPVGTPAVVTGITGIDSPDGSIVVTNPTGPVVSLEAAPSTSTLFDLVLSYGHGMAADAELPTATSFWFSPTTIADLARADQVREWVTTDALAFLAIVVRVDAAHLVTGGASFIVTVNGLDTAIALAVATGDTTDTTLQTSVLLPVAAGSRVGVRWNGSALAAGSTLRAEIRLRGAATGTPIVANALPLTAKALFRPEDLALDGSSWIDSVAGNLYTLTVPADGPPPPGVDPISGPARTLDGSFNNHPYGYFRHYHGTDFGSPIYTPCMLATSTSMFAASAAPIAPRTFVAVVRPESSVGGIVMSSQFTTPCFKGALSLPLGDLLQAAYFTLGTPDSGGQVDHVIPAVNLAAQEIVLIWRTDGTTLEFFINGVKQTLDDATIGTDNAAGEGFCIGNLASSKPIGKTGWQGAIAFVGTWARKFSDTEVLNATSYCTTNYVTP